ncbi:MAG: hypothetical protein RI885_348 [Actinomycetota bacterium]|jgi:pimeloyl-ACP methyl ester carboxylesterase
MRVVFVHGACVRDGEWWWSRMSPLLAREGVSSVSARLPSCGEGDRETGPDGPGLADDVAALHAVLRSVDEPTTVVAHSYGGIVASEAIAGVPSIRHLLLISSYLPEVGESLADFGSPEPAPFLDADPVRGTLAVRPELLADTFLQDCDIETRSGAGLHLAHQSLKVVGSPVAVAGWKDVATTYLVCADDRGTPPALQRRFADRADRRVEMASGHHPFLSRPVEVRDLILDH